jgi:general secretion pathway protein A
VAGATREIFSSMALAELHRRSGGLPRLINIIADRAMLGAFANDRHEITPTVVRAAAAEVAGVAPRSWLWVWLAVIATGILVAAGAILLLR